MIKTVQVNVLACIMWCFQNDYKRGRA